MRQFEGHSGKRRLVFVCGSFAMVALVLGHWAWREDVRPLATRPEGSQPASFAGWIRPTTQGALPTAGATFETGLEAWPSSLRGTEVDGKAEMDAKGRLIVNRRLRDLFDYFLSIVGEEPLDRVVARVRAYLHSNLQQEAAASAQALLDRYVAYQGERGKFATKGSSAVGNFDVSTVKGRLDALSALRQKYFTSSEREAFFGEEEAEARYALARGALASSTTMSLADKALRLKELRQSLPLSMQESMAQTDVYENLRAITKEWQAQGGSPAQLRKARETLVGAEAADRLEKLDAERREWAERVRSYRAQQSDIVTHTEWSEPQRQAASKRLIAELFTPEERLRLASLAPSSP